VLREPRNALVKQYQKLFEIEESELHFTDEALRLIAERAMEKETGARGLRSIVEEIMLDIMFDLPDRGRGSRYDITGDVVAGRQRVLPMPVPKNKSA
jgi:ATP-dependent Clp protease ATP-binding subunit ClpX